MRLTTKKVRHIARMIDTIIEEYKEEAPSRKRDWRTYEQRTTERLRKAFQELSPLVKEATQTLTVIDAEKKGNKPKLNPEQKVITLLLSRLLQKSNRNMATMMIIFSWLTGVSVSYKTVERLYSDEKVILTLNNLHRLILKKRGVTAAECSGDGTGYALTIKMHYASHAQKLKENPKECRKTKVVFSFALMDLQSRMYIGYGTSMKSENEAFHQAIELAEQTGIGVNSVRLDKYYSTQSRAKLLQKSFGDLKIYLIPKTNATLDGPQAWKSMLMEFTTDTKGFLKEYFQRNQSESSIAEDKKRTGWKLGQKREDRIITADFCTLIWHNLSWLYS